MDKRVYVVLISSLAILISLTYQGTYSYFSTTVEGTGNTEHNTSTVTTDELTDLVINGNAIANTNPLIPGDVITQTFTVQNDNSIRVCFNLLWSNTTNTFINQDDVVVHLEDSDGTVIVNETVFPATNAGTTLLASGVQIPAETTETYTLTVTYKNTDELQNADIGKSFNGTIIGELGVCS